MGAFLQQVSQERIQHGEANDCRRGDLGDLRDTGEMRKAFPGALKSSAKWNGVGWGVVVDDLIRSYLRLVATAA